MPKLPSAKDLGVAEAPKVIGPVGTLQVNVPDTTAAARAQAGLGRTLMGVGDDLYEAHQRNLRLEEIERRQFIAEQKEREAQEKALAREAAREQARVDNDRIEDAVNQATVVSQNLHIGEGGFSHRRGKDAGQPILGEYTAKFDESIKAIEQGLEERQREEFKRRVTPVRTNYTGRILGHIAEQTRAFADQTAAATLEIASDHAVINYKNPSAQRADFARINYTLDQAAERHGWSPEKLETEKQKAESAIHLNVIDTILQKQAPGYYKEADSYFKAVRSRLDPEVVKVLEGHLTTARKQAEAEAKSARSQANELIASNLEINVRRRKAGYADIERAFKADQITGAKRTQLFGILDEDARKAAEAAEKENRQIELVGAVVSGRTSLDFRDSQSKEAVDVYFRKNIMPQLSTDDPEKSAQVIAAFSGQVGMVPPVVQGQLRGAARSRNPQAISSAADLLDRIKINNPEVLKDLTPEDTALLYHVNAQTQAGVPTAKAVSNAFDALKQPTAERDTREKLYREQKAPVVNQKYLNDQIATGWNLFSANQPSTVPAEMLGEFEARVREEYIRGGDLEVAQKIALDQLQNVWAVTQVDGKMRWMKRAPEVMYRVPGQDGSWIREQLNREVRGNAVMAEGTEITIAPDDITARQERPSYGIFITNKFGGLEPMMNEKGERLRFTPDFSSSPAAERQKAETEKQKAEAEAVVDKERAKRDEAREKVKEKVKGRVSEGKIRSVPGAVEESLKGK